MKRVCGHCGKVVSGLCDCKKQIVSSSASNDRLGLPVEERKEWISVEDRLPLEQGKVLICYGEPTFGSFSAEIECGYYDEDSSTWLFWLSDREVRGSGITHWMPLPELPK